MIVIIIKSVLLNVNCSGKPYTCIIHPIVSASALTWFVRYNDTEIYSS